MKHAAMFTDELGTVLPYKAKLYIRSDAVPKFIKPRSVPYATKQAIEDELDHFKASRILRRYPQRVGYPNCSSTKGRRENSHLQRLQGDCQPSIGSRTTLPKPEDLFATLAEGTKFTTLDLSQAYLQLLLDNESSKPVTVNTHRGLYQYTCLPFSIDSASSMFQTDTILPGIPNVIRYIDDILVTGSSNEAHLESRRSTHPIKKTLSQNQGRKM